MGNDSVWYFTGAKLFPNVKGCGYPPMLNCSIFYRQYANIGQNFSCYYSKVDPGIVISELDMWQVSALLYTFYADRSSSPRLYTHKRAYTHTHISSLTLSSLLGFPIELVSCEFLSSFASLRATASVAS